MNAAVIYRAAALAARRPLVAGKAILAEAARLSADCLVIGAYGHARVRERVLGGATRHILQHADIPVLMQH